MSARVLLITPLFYSIEKKIKSLLEGSGYEVVWLENKSLSLDYHSTNSRFRLIRRIYFLIFSPHKRYIKEELSRIEDNRFDILFSINCHIICPYLFSKLKKINSRLFSVLYLWDAFAMYSWEKEIRYFNKVYTFDRGDSEKYHIEYKPNFYVRYNFENEPKEEEYDLFFVGKFNPSRLSIASKVISQAEESGIKYYIKLWPAYKIFFHHQIIYKLLRNAKYRSNWVRNYLLNYEAIEGIMDRKFLVDKNMSYEEMEKHLLYANVILDIPFQWQTGYTHRFMEALANGKKVITTYSGIKDETFYNSEQIRILNKQNPVIDYNWIKEKSTFPVDAYFLDLELLPWLKSMVNVEIA